MADKMPPGRLGPIQSRKVGVMATWEPDAGTQYFGMNYGVGPLGSNKRTVNWWWSRRSRPQPPRVRSQTREDAGARRPSTRGERY